MADEVQRTVVPTMSLTMAEAIINEAKRAGVVTYAMPPDEAQRFTRARELVAKAEQASASGNRSAVVTAILRLAEGDGESHDTSSPPPADPAKVAGREPVPTGEERTPAPTPGDPTHQSNGSQSPQQSPSEATGAPPVVAESKGSSAPHRGLSDIPGRIERRIAEAGLPLPPKPEGEVPVFPTGLTSIPDGELRNQMGQWNGWLNHVATLLAREEGQLGAAKFIEEIEYAKALKLVEGTDATGKPKLAEAKRLEARAMPAVKDLSEAIVEHDGMVRMLKALHENYKNNVDRLSRELTARLERRS